MLKGKDYLFITLAGIAGYTAYRIFNFGDTATRAVSKLWEGLTFSKGDLPPQARLKKSAQLSQADMIRRGYLVIDSTGRSRITPAGEAYITAQREKNAANNR